MQQADFMTKDGTIIVAPIKPEEKQQKKSVKMRLRTAWDCCRQTYYATLCALLILIGCPMAAVGSQVKWNVCQPLWSDFFSESPYFLLIRYERGRFIEMEN